MSTYATTDDPRKLRELLTRTASLCRRHRISWVLVGFTAPEGERLFADFLRFVESELRVEDNIFRLTRERALLFITDIELPRARAVVERMRGGFRQDFPSLRDFELQTRYLQIDPTQREVAVKDVLPAVFGEAEAPGAAELSEAP